MKKRFLFTIIEPYFNDKNAIVITGMRQVGKTTLLKQIHDSIQGENRLWFDFDNPFDQKIFEELDYNNIYKKLSWMTQNKNERLFIFIDEIQNYPEITKIIKFLIDYYRVKFFVTGSSNFYLKNLFPESLSGRKFLYHLSPLSFQEFLYLRGKEEIQVNKPKTIEEAIKAKNEIFYQKYKTDYQEYIEFGGFPEVVLTSDFETKKLIIKNILTSFFEKDIHFLSDWKDIRELRELILLMVPRVGSLLDITKIANELGINRAKIYHFLEFLQGCFFLQLLPKYSKSIDRSVAGGKKVYFSDSGLLNHIGNVTSGQILENTVINQLKNWGNISFFNQRNESEIDAIYENKIAFEIKTKGTSIDIQKLDKRCIKLGIPESYIISNEWSDDPRILPAMNF
jgi:uncharacterized protein